MGGEVVHCLDPADDFPEAQGLFNAGARNALCMPRQTLAKGILYLLDKVNRRNQTPNRNSPLAFLDHIPKVTTLYSLSSYGTFNHPPKRRDITFILVAKSQATH